MGTYRSRTHVWTPEETELFRDMYGRESTAFIMRHFNLSYHQFRYKAQLEKLGYQRNANEYLTVKQVATLMKISHRTVDTHYARDGLPLFKRRFGLKKVNTLISMTNLLAWLEAHQDRWSALKVEPYAFGEEPKWLKEKRRKEREHIGIEKLNKKLEQEELRSYRKTGLEPDEIMEYVRAKSDGRLIILPKNA